MRKEQLLATTEVSIRSVDLKRQELLVLFKCITISRWRPQLGGRFALRARMQLFVSARRPDSGARSNKSRTMAEYLAALALQAEYSRPGFDAAFEKKSCPA